MNTQTKKKQVQRILQELGSMAIAFSGGVDSTLLLALALEVCRPKVLAVTIDSPIYGAGDLNQARSLAKKLECEHLVLPGRQLHDQRFCANPPERCYLCKSVIYKDLLGVARFRDLAAVIDGANADDLSDYRPGHQAARENGILSPLQEAGLSKAEIRILAREMGLPNWDKPSSPCFCTRIPYGESITLAKLQQVESAEALLRQMGFRQVRVRHHGTIARIEVPADQLVRLLQASVRQPLLQALKQFGFTYVAADLNGFQSGSMNIGVTQTCGGS